MGRLIRLDRSGHTTLARVDGGRRRRRRGGGRGVPRRARPRDGRLGRATPTAPPRSSASCRSTPSWSSCGARSPAAERSSDRRRSRRPPARRARGGRAAALARGRQRADAAPRRAALDRVDVLDLLRLRRPGRAAARDRAADLPGRADLLRPRLGVPWIQARRGARQVVADRRASAAPRRVATPTAGAEAVALGLLGDLVGHRERDLLRETRPGAPARRARRLAGRRAGRVPGPLAAAGGSTAGASASRRDGASSPAGRPGRPPAAGPARGRARVREGREPRLLGRPVAGAPPAARAPAAGARRRAPAQARLEPQAAARESRSISAASAPRISVIAVVVVVGDQCAVVVERLVGRASGRSRSTTRAPVEASTLRSSACAQTAPKLPVVAPITAAGLPWSGVSARGREAQSIAFLSTPGIDELYSGVANSRPSASAIACAQLGDRRAAASGRRRPRRRAGSTSGRPRSRSRRRPAPAPPAWRSRRALWESRRTLPRDREDPHRVQLFWNSSSTTSRTSLAERLAAAGELHLPVHPERGPVDRRLERERELARCPRRARPGPRSRPVGLDREREAGHRELAGDAQVVGGAVDRGRAEA